MTPLESGPLRGGPRANLMRFFCDVCGWVHARVNASPSLVDFRSAAVRGWPGILFYVYVNWKLSRAVFSLLPARFLTVSTVVEVVASIIAVLGFGGAGLVLFSFVGACFCACCPARAVFYSTRARVRFTFLVLRKWGRELRIYAV